MKKIIILAFTLGLMQNALGASRNPGAESPHIGPEATSTLQIPSSYEAFMAEERKRRKFIPDKAKNSKNSGEFLSNVLDYHLNEYLESNPDSELVKLKSLEKSVSESTSVTTDSFKLQSKLDVAKASARLDIEYLLDYHIWFENQFRQINAEIDLYSTQSTRLGINYSSNQQDTRTQLGFKVIW